MVKTLETNASYEPCKRSLNWLKLKKDYMEGMTDSVDLVPVGAWFGKGKRTGTFGAYLMACFEADDEEFQAITKVGTGFSDEFLAEATKFFKDNEYVREKPPMNVVPPTSLVPDVWLEPAQVWEVKAADLSISPAYRAAVGHVDPAKGIALRFPRFLRIRDDKNPEHATNSEQIAQMYRDQGNVGSGGAGGGHVSDDDMLY
ncbi:lig1 [Symbiodinium sp. KB8]|nr:lig1 [Symbiodinium sp. KB8]